MCNYPAGGAPNEKPEVAVPLDDPKLKPVPLPPGTVVAVDPKENPVLAVDSLPVVPAALEPNEKFAAVDAAEPPKLKPVVAAGLSAPFLSADELPKENPVEAGVEALESADVDPNVNPVFLPASSSVDFLVVVESVDLKVKLELFPNLTGSVEDAAEFPKTAPM